MDEKYKRRHLKRHDARARRNFSRNYAAHAIEGGLYMAGLAFISFETVLPPIVKSLGGPAWLISLAPALCTIGISIPPLFTAHLLEPLTRKMPVVVLAGVFIRIPFLFAALCLLFLSDSHPLLTLAMVALAPFLNGFINGFTLPAWFELLAKTVPANRRASLFAIRLVIAGAGALFAGWLIGGVLKAWPGATGYGILHLCTFGLLMMSYAAFVRIKETPLPPLRKDIPETVFESFQEIPRILKADRNFRSFLVMRLFSCAPYVAIPFLSIHALATAGLPESALGGLFICFTLGSVGGNLFAGYCGDRFGSRLPLLSATLLYMAALLLSAVATSHLAFMAVFALVGFCRDASNVTNGALTAELPPHDMRLKYMSIASSVFAPGMLIASALGSLAWSLGSGRYLFPALLAVLLLAAALRLAWRLDYPERESKL